MRKCKWMIFFHFLRRPLHCLTAQCYISRIVFAFAMSQAFIQLGKKREKLFYRATVMKKKRQNQVLQRPETGRTVDIS